MPLKSSGLPASMRLRETLVTKIASLGCVLAKVLRSKSERDS